MMRPVWNRRWTPWIAAAILGVVGAAPAWAQNQPAVINGRVVETGGNPILGANVVIPELNISVGTNEEGRYTITVPAARVRGQTVMLRVRSIGRKPDSRQIVISAGTQTINFTLEEDINRLEAVVTTGVATGTAQVKVPFAVSQIDSTQMPVVGGNAVQQLQGKIAGANIQAASGRPGAAPSVILRAPTSINATGRGQGPLYIVDGVILNGDSPDINPSDIETIEVVKGAAAASLYGARAGGGVINIRTKSGRTAREGIKFGVRSEYGISDIARQFAIAEQSAVAMDPTGQYFCGDYGSGGSHCARLIDMETERLRVNDVTTPHAASTLLFMNDFGISANPQRYRAANLFQATTFPTTYNQVEQATKADQWANVNLDMRGNVGNTGVYGSVGLTRQAGAFEYLDGYRRASGRLNVDQLIGPVNIQASTFYSTTKEDGGNQEGGTAFFRLSRQPAFVNQHTRDSQGRLYIRSNPFRQGSQNENPLYWLEQYDYTEEGSRFLGSVQARYAATDWLDFNGDFAYDRATERVTWLQDRGFRSSVEDAATAAGFIQNDADEDRSINTSIGATLRPQLFSNLQATFTGQVLYDAQYGLDQSGYGEDLAVPGLRTLNAASVNKDITSGTDEIKSLSYRGGLDLEFLERYILSTSLRREGSSLFGRNHQWATFPRIAAAWIASSEPWFPAPDAVSLAKVRVAWGKAGQRPNSVARYETFTVNRETGALSPATLGNEDLRPEILTELEVGTDLEFFGRYAFNLTYAESKADDQILLVPAPASSGFPNQWQNAGQLTSKSWEASLDIPIINQRDLRWSTRLIYDRNRSVITRLDVPAYNTTGGVQGSESMFFVREGERLGNIYGAAFVTECNQLPSAYQSQCGGAGSQFQRNSEGYIVWTGGFATTEGITRNLWNASLNPANAPWGVRTVWGMPMQQRCNDGENCVLNSVKQVHLGNATPDFHGGLSTNFSWKRFSVYGLLDGSFGREVWNEGYHWALGDFMTGDADQAGKSVEDAKPIGYYYRAGPASQGGSSGIGGYYNALGPTNESVEDASYVKLRETSVTYNVGPIAGQGDWTVGVVGRNLYTWTKYRGYDPEVGRSGGTQLANSALVGIDYFTFPNLRTVTLQLSTSF